MKEEEGVTGVDEEEDFFDEEEDFFDDDEYNVNSHLMHQMDVFVEEKEEDFMDDDDFLEEEKFSPSPLRTELAPQEEILRPTRWTWDMSKSQKVVSLKAVVDMFCSLLLDVVSKIEDEMNSERRKYREEQEMANTQILQGCDVIGSTVVSCIASS